MAKAATKAVVTKEQAKAPAVTEFSGYEEYAGQGLGDITSEDKGLPFFEVLTINSPEVEEIEAAQPGMIINKATKELFSSIRFVASCRDHVYTEWVPREKGGGLVATYQLDDAIVRAAREKQRVGKHELPNGNELIETFYLYGCVLDENDSPIPAVIAFSSTKIAAYKQLTMRADSLMFRTADGRKLKFPWFAHVWKLGTEKKKKDKYTWYVWTVAFDGANDKAEEARLLPSSEAFQAAASLFEAQSKGGLKVNTEGLRNEGSGVDGGGDGDPNSVDPPF